MFFHGRLFVRQHARGRKKNPAPFLVPLALASCVMIGAVYSTIEEGMIY